MSIAASSAQRSERRSVPRRRFQGRAWRETVSFYLFISPWLLGFLALSVVPLALGFAASLTNYDGYNLDSLRFRGVDNYLRALDDPEVWHALWRTVVFSIMNVPLSIGLALLLAILLNGAIPARGIFRTIFYLPHILPIVAVVWIWRIFVDQNYGLVNGMLSWIWPDTAIRWTVDYPTQVLTALTVWMGIGGGMVIFLAGLQGVPNELKEAARIDGATTPQLYRAVIVPLLTPVIFFELVLTMIRSLQTLVAPMLLAGDQLASIPVRDNYLLLVHAYQQVFAQQRYGYGLALIWMFLVVIVALTYAVFKSSKYWVYYEVEQDGGQR
jgi:multiple sugar transport system permease protein